MVILVAIAFTFFFVTFEEFIFDAFKTKRYYAYFYYSTTY